MIEIDDKLVSLEIFHEKFVCDLKSCKGACCVKGDSGAPLRTSEINVIEDNLDEIKKNMRQEGIDAVNDKGVFYVDQDNEPVTMLVNKEECAFVFFDDNNIAKCAIEKTYQDKKINFLKPISCHLYPIRVSQLNSHQAINYNQWNICESACDFGKESNVKVYQFLKDAIIRKWGEKFYLQLNEIDIELQNKKIRKKQN